MAWPKRGAPFKIRNKNPNMLEGLPAIAGFLGKSPATAKKWILDHGLPACKTPEGTWLTHKALILQWIYAGHKTEIKHIKRDQSTPQRARYAFRLEDRDVTHKVHSALEPEGLEELAAKMEIDIDV